GKPLRGSSGGGQSTITATRVTERHAAQHQTDRTRKPVRHCVSSYDLFYREVQLLRSLSLVALTALAIGCADSATNPRHARFSVLSGKSVTIDALVTHHGAIVTGTSAGEVQAFSLVGTTQTLLGAEAAETFTSMNVTVPQGASLVLKVLPFMGNTLINWFQG